MPSQVLIVGSAPVPGAASFYGRLLGASAFVIACDAAAEWCVTLGRTPEIAIGDFDSAAHGAPERLATAGVEIVRFSAEKDESDLDLALVKARSLGVASVSFTAAFSQRLDHTLAALGTACAAADLNARIEEPGFAAQVLSKRGTMSTVFNASAGDIVSVIALEPSAGVTLAGLRYPLVWADVPVLSALGLSNVALGGKVHISLAVGTLLVIVSRYGEDAAAGEGTFFACR